MDLQILELEPKSNSANTYCPITGACLGGGDYDAPSPAAVAVWCGEDVNAIVADDSRAELAAAWVYRL